QTLTLKKVQGSAKFSAGGHDSASIAGVLPNLPAGFSPSGQAFVLNIGGATATFTLDAKGRAKSTQGTVSLKLKMVRDKTTQKINFQRRRRPIYRAPLGRNVGLRLEHEPGDKQQQSFDADADLCSAIRRHIR